MADNGVAVREGVALGVFVGLEVGEDAFWPKQETEKMISIDSVAVSALIIWLPEEFSEHRC
jgi:hypothetical protein